MEGFFAHTLFDGERIYHDTLLAVEMDRIVYVGSRDGAPKAAIEACKQIPFLMPGLVDCHVHLAPAVNMPSSPADWAWYTAMAIENWKKLREAGVVACRDLGCAGGTIIGLSRFQQEGFGTQLPWLMSAGSAIDVEALKTKGWEACRINCQNAIDQGAGVIKLLINEGEPFSCASSNPQKDVEAFVAAAHELGRKVAAHAHSHIAIQHAVWAGVDSVEHGVCCSPDLLALMAQKQITLVPTLSALHYAVEVGCKKEPLNPVFKQFQASIANHRSVVLQAFQAGVKLAMGTDAGSPFNPFEKACFELVLLSQAGIPPQEALRIGTKNGAELLGMEKLGRLKAGFEASFITLSASPLENIENIMGAKQVYIRGKRVV